MLGREDTTLSLWERKSRRGARALTSEIALARLRGWLTGSMPS